MKSILISIKPKWVAKILNGEKTIEIRKTMPKCDLPIDVYIYCTKDKEPCFAGVPRSGKYTVLNGKVVAKFTLNKVEEITNRYCKGMLIDSCLTNYELNNYLGNSVGYAWHISNLKIFDEPKELSEFNKYGCEQYDKDVCAVYGERGHLYTNCFFHLTKAPQSMCYIESEK